MGILYFLLILAVFALDRYTKMLIIRSMPLWASRPLWGRWLHLTHVRNTGAAFGFFGGRPLFLAAISAFFFILLYFWRKQLSQLNFWGKMALALIAGGAVGNLYDRLLYGYVVDFIDLKLWPVFNIADCAVVAGAFLLAIILWRHDWDADHAA